MIDFYKMPEKEIVLLSAAIAVLLTEDLNVDEQNTLGNFLMTVGQNIVLGAGQKEIRAKEKEKEKKDANDIK